MRRLTIEYRMDCLFWLFIEWIVFKNSTPFQDEIAYLCWMSGQPIERKAHRSRSCTPATVSKIGQEEGTWKCNMHSPVEKIQKQHLFELQVLQQTTPHFLQWWRRFTNVNWTWKIVWLWYTRMITCHIHNVYWHQGDISVTADRQEETMNERETFLQCIHVPASLSGTHTAAWSSTAFFPDLRKRSCTKKWRWIRCTKTSEANHLDAFVDVSHPLLFFGRSCSKNCKGLAPEHSLI